jgi:glucose-6-phosphate 1-epimerase
MRRHAGGHAVCFAGLTSVAVLSAAIRNHSGSKAMSIHEETGVGGLPRLRLEHPSGARAELYLQGAHVTSWQPAGGAEWLFLSRSAKFAAGAPIRGGIPVVFPQFADRGPLPKHGFVRTMPWRWVTGADTGDATSASGDASLTSDDATSASDDATRAGRGAAADAVRVVLELTDSAASMALWPHRFRTRLAVELGATSLRVALEVVNTGEQPLAFTGALHSYFRVAAAGRAAVQGLAGARYLDKTADMAKRTQSAPLVRVDGEVDRVYVDAPAAVSLLDEAADRELQIAGTGFGDVVIWNPWQDLADELEDLSRDEYQHMLCVEAAQAVQPVELAPGGRWHGAQQLQQR